MSRTRWVVKSVLLKCDPICRPALQTIRQPFLVPPNSNSNRLGSLICAQISIQAPPGRNPHIHRVVDRRVDRIATGDSGACEGDIAHVACGSIASFRPWASHFRSTAMNRPGWCGSCQNRKSRVRVAPNKMAPTGGAWRDPHLSAPEAVRSRPYEEQ